MSFQIFQVFKGKHKCEENISYKKEPKITSEKKKFLDEINSRLDTTKKSVSLKDKATETTK